MLNGTATKDTTYKNAPGVKTDFGITKVAPGGSYSIATMPCAAGQKIAFEMTGVMGTSLNYFQDFNPSP